MINNIFNELSSVIDTRDLVVTREIEILQTLIFHYSLLQQLFQNLIKNSPKFSKGNKNSIFIRCETIAYDYLKFSVKDIGFGIPKPMLPKVFDIFAKYHREENPDIAGSGIGLATCKRIVDFMGGTISVQSIENVETAFTFTIKVRPNGNNTFEVLSD